jgi:CRISPR-associated protein (TIGR02710 family)
LACGDRPESREGPNLYLAGLESTMKPPITGDSDRHPRAMILTIGVPADPRQDIVEALMAEVEASRPEEVVLIASGESHKNAKRMVRLMEESAAASGAGDRSPGEGETKPPAGRIVRLESAHDLEEAFLEANRAIERLIEKGIAPEEVAINFTSGTKMMSAGAVLSAVFNRCMQLRYVVGAEAGSKNRRVIRTHPGAVFALQDIRRARSLAMELRFKSAIDLLHGVDDSLLAASDRNLLAALIRVAEAYDAWQHFHPERFLEAYPGIDLSHPLLEPFVLKDGQLDEVRRLAEEMQNGEMGPYLLTDLFNNGLRQLEAGEPDDALIRLYRALELLAQWILLRDHGIDTNDVEVRRIPPRDRVGFEALRSLEDGLVKIGLRKAYDLLIILDTGVGRRFTESEPMKTFLQQRTRSILAHGIKPIDIPDPVEVFHAAAELIEVELSPFSDRCLQLQFPWIGVASKPRLD